MPDPAFAEKIYSAFEAELRIKNRVNSFEKFCERVELPDLEAKTLDDVKLQLAAAFGAGGEASAGGVVDRRCEERVRACEPGSGASTEHGAEQAAVQIGISEEPK